MFDVGWPELLVIAIVLIVVVGPEDLPRMLRAFGKATARMRTMAGEFRTQFDEALKEADLDDVRKTISDAQKLNPTKSLRDAMNPLRQVGEDIRSGLNDAVKPGSISKPEETLPTTPEKPSMDIGTPAAGLNGSGATTAETVTTAEPRPAAKRRTSTKAKAASSAGSSRKAQASASGNGVASGTPASKSARSKTAAKTAGERKPAAKATGSVSTGTAAPAASGNGGATSAPRKSSRKPAASTARAKAAKKDAPRKGADEADT